MTNETKANFFLKLVEFFIDYLETAQEPGQQLSKKTTFILEGFKSLRWLGIKDSEELINWAESEDSEEIRARIEDFKAKLEKGLSDVSWTVSGVESLFPNFPIFQVLFKCLSWMDIRRLRED